MRSISLYIVAIGIIVARAVVPWLARSDRQSARSLLRVYGAQPTGPGGVWLRRDYLRGGGWHLFSALASWTMGVAIMTLADHWPTNSRANNIASVPGMTLFFLGFIFIWLSMRDLVRAARTRTAPGSPSRSSTSGP